MKLRTLIMLGLFVIIMGGCQILQKPETIASDSSSSQNANYESNQKAVLKGLVVNRGVANIAFDEVYSIVDNVNLYYYNIIKDIHDLRWIAARGGCGNDEPYDAWISKYDVHISELGVIQESNSLVVQNGFESDGTLSDNSRLKDPYEVDYVWVRLIYEPYIIEPSPGDVSHKDIILYIDPNNLNNAILAEQNPQDLSLWSVYTLPGYGTWLAKEVDMLLRMSIGF